MSTVCRAIVCWRICFSADGEEWVVVDSSDRWRFDDDSETAVGGNRVSKCVVERAVSEFEILGENTETTNK